MGYILYGDPGSGSAIVELALAEIGVGVELRDVSLDDGQQSSSDYAAVNTQRKLPSLITPNGTTLTESAAILLTLAERHPEAGLLPEASRDRAIALRWLLFMAAELYPIIEFHDYPERFQPEGNDTPSGRRDDLRVHATAIWQRRWLLVEAAAEADPWFQSCGFGVLDIYAAVLCQWALDDAWRSEKLPGVASIAQRIAGRESLKRVWKRHFE
ncbi:MAG: glutathione S-transferase family protein [Woeseia sp.]